MSRLQTITKAHLLKHLESIPMDGRITISVTLADCKKAQKQSVFEDSCSFGFTGETSLGTEGIEFIAWTETE